MKEPFMASTMTESTAPGSRNETQVRPVPVAQPPKTAREHFQQYARERPGVVALWCLGIGFMLGWKFKLW